MRCLKWILTSLVGVPAWTPAFAALSTLPPAASFYRSPESYFRSGQASRAILAEGQLRTEFEYNLQVEWDRKTYTLKSGEILQDLHCASRVALKENSQLLGDRRSDALVMGELNKGQVLPLLEIRDHWARVRTTSGIEGWMPASRLETRSDDLGVYIPVIETFLRDRPDNDGKILTTLPRRARLEATVIHDSGWIGVNYRGQKGYVDIHHVGGRGDFATWAWVPPKGWLMVTHREGSVLRAKSGEKIKLTDVRGYAASPAKGIVMQNDPNVRPPLRAHVMVRKTEATLWGVSRLDGHGDVWWKKESIVVQDKPEKAPWLTTEELLQRDVFSYALTQDPKKPQGLASAKGIWKTEDGARWTKLLEFGDQDLPVSIHTAGVWFVGTQQSSDQGKTFEPYIRWDSLTRTVEENLLRPPLFLRLQRIESLPSQQIEILVDTGIRRLSLRSPLHAQNWRVVKAPSK